MSEAKGGSSTDDTASSSDGEWEVEDIMAEKTQGGQTYFLIKWKGWPSSSNTWEPEVHLDNCPQVLRRYRTHHEPRSDNPRASRARSRARCSSASVPLLQEDPISPLASHECPYSLRSHTLSDNQDDIVSSSPAIARSSASKSPRKTKTRRPSRSHSDAVRPRSRSRRRKRNKPRALASMPYSEPAHSDSEHRVPEDDNGDTGDADGDSNDGGLPESDDEWIVESIVDHKTLPDASKMYLLKWKGWGSAHNSWEPEAHLTHCPQLLELYHRGSGQERSDGPTSGDKREHAGSSAPPIESAANDTTAASLQPPPQPSLSDDLASNPLSLPWFQRIGDVVAPSAPFSSSMATCLSLLGHSPASDEGLSSTQIRAFGRMTLGYGLCHLPMGLTTNEMVSVHNHVVSLFDRTLDTVQRCEVVHVMCRLLLIVVLLWCAALRWRCSRADWGCSLTCGKSGLSISNCETKVGQLPFPIIFNAHLFMLLNMAHCAPLWTGRFDLRISEEKLSPKEFPFLYDQARWLPLIRFLFSNDFHRAHCGLMLALPDSQPQIYHCDGLHMSNTHHLPPYAINVFIPLIDVDTQNGPTEFVPTSHLLGHFYTETTPVILPLVEAGHCLVFDYRIRHRGLSNRSLNPRPVLYITYAKRSFKDPNFSKQRYLPMPELLPSDRWRGRQSRADARDSASSSISVAATSSSSPQILALQVPAAAASSQVFASSNSSSALLSALSAADGSI